MSTDDEGGSERTRLVDDDFAASAPRLEAEERHHYLLELEGLSPGLRIPLANAPVTFGRAPPAEVRLADTEVSRAHCCVEVVGREVQVTDLLSTNGTYIDSERIQGVARLPNGGTLRLGRHLFRLESGNRREMAATQKMERDMVAARSYMQSLLPPRLTTGPVLADWLFEPSARIGGDALGYHALDDEHFALYLIDVAGHGASAALHAASVINVMRKKALPGVDMRQPERVMRGLNKMFQMEDHDQMFFTAWYGVYCRNERELRYCSGGHHPGYLVDAQRHAAAPLATENPVLGAVRAHEYRGASTAVPPGTSLYLFSDGVFEVAGADGAELTLDDFLPLLLAPQSAAQSEPERLIAEVKRATGRNEFEDDLTLLVVGFP